jgi:hypothetical protein
MALIESLKNLAHDAVKYISGDKNELHRDALDKARQFITAIDAAPPRSSSEEYDHIKNVIDPASEAFYQSIVLLREKALDGETNLSTFQAALISDLKFNLERWDSERVLNHPTLPVRDQLEKFVFETRKWL